MALNFYPGAWRIMMCDFDKGFVTPEMVKRRPVITISRSRNDGTPLCTVIPISSSKPDILRDYHYLLPQEELPRKLQNTYPESWVKIDMITTVSFQRLNLLWNGRTPDGKRCYQTKPIIDAHKEEISRRLSSYLYLL